MTDFNKHSEVLVDLAAVQSAESDQRDASREAHLFIDKPNGQWEPYWWRINEKKPRYTFDQTSPIVDQVSGEMERAEFAVNIKPAGGEATKEIAKTFDGLVRNIQRMSNAKDIYTLAGTNVVTAGLDGWLIKQKFIDDDSFYQDLVIEPIANFIDSVWFGPFKRWDASDAPWCIVLEAVPAAKYKGKYSDGSGKSVGDGKYSQAYYHKGEQVVIGQIYYIKEVPRELLLMTSGRVLEATEAEPILDELAAAGEVVKERRTRVKNVVYSRLFDGGRWLNEPQKTVFNQLPVIPVIANFKVFENKVLWRGVVTKLMDPQRVFNYTKSREVEEAALAPRAKFWLTLKQMLGFEPELATLNTNADPIQRYTPDPLVQNPPVQTGGAAVNAGLATLSADMNGIIRQTGGLFAANMGDNPGLQSGVALRTLQNKGDIGTIKYFSAMERAICRTGRILVDAIPKIYDKTRQVRILKEDGSFSMTVLNQSIRDEQTNRIVVINDLSVGTYDVTCSSGPAFQNRQEETVSTIVEMGRVDPTVIELGGDVLFNNITAPGMELIAERKRIQLFNAGLIPPGQQTEEEKQQAAQAQQQPPAADPNMVIAEAEASKAQAQQDKVVVDMNIAKSKEQRENFKVQLAKQAQQFEQMLAAQEVITERLNTQAEALKFLREGLGDTVPEGTPDAEAFNRQIGIILDAQGDTAA